MPDNVRARDLALRNFATVDRHDRLGVALNALIELQAREDMPNALIVQDVDGGYIGVLSARLLVRVLSSGVPSCDGLDAETHETRLLEGVRDYLDRTVTDLLPSDLPSVTPDSRILALIRACCESRLEYIPVVEDGRPFGIVPVTAVFQATASLVLTPEDEGIRPDQADD